MKNITLLSAIMLVVNLMSAQAFVKGTSTLSAGLGLGGRMGVSLYSSQTPALSAQFEKGIWEVAETGVISLGGYVGYKSYKYSRDYRYYNTSSKWAYTIVGLRSAYHFTGLETDKLDLYAGAMLSFNKLSYSYDVSYKNGNEQYYDYDQGTDRYGSTFGLTFYSGVRYYPKKNIGFFAEAGYGISYLTLGTTIKF